MSLRAEFRQGAFAGLFGIVLRRRIAGRIRVDSDVFISRMPPVARDYRRIAARKDGRAGVAIRESTAQEILSMPLLIKAISP